MSIFRRRREPTEEEVQEYAESAEAYEEELKSVEESERKERVSKSEAEARRAARKQYEKRQPLKKKLGKNIRGGIKKLKEAKAGGSGISKALKGWKESPERRKLRRKGEAMSSGIFGPAPLLGKKGRGAQDFLGITGDKSTFDAGDMFKTGRVKKRDPFDLGDVTGLKKGKRKGQFDMSDLVGTRKKKKKRQGEKYFGGWL